MVIWYSRISNVTDIVSQWNRYNGAKSVNHRQTSFGMGKKTEKRKNVPVGIFNGTDIMEQRQSTIDKRPSEWEKKTEQRKNVPVLPRARFVVLVAPASSWSLGPSFRPPCCARTAFLGGRWYSYWHCRRCHRR